MAPTDSERMLLQRMMAAGAMDEYRVHSLAQALTGEEMTTAQVDAMVTALGARVHPFGLDIRRGVYDDGKVYVGVVNTSNDPLTQFSSNYKPWEIVFLRKAMEEIVESEDGALDESDLVNLRENASISEVSALLHKLSGEKWLAPSATAANSFTLGPRAYLELVSFLRDLEIRKCAICQSELLQGVRCQSSGTDGTTCGTLVHVSCIERYEVKGLRYKCPSCKHAMRGGSEGRRKSTGGDGEEGGEGSTSRRKSSRRQR